MGQYYTVANLDKKEFLYAHKLDSGVKALEIVGSNVPNVLMFLLCKSNGGGGGDGNSDIPLVRKFLGRWARNRIVMIGDYDSSKLYEKIDDGEQRGIWKDISIPCAFAYNHWLGWGGDDCRIDMSEEKLRDTRWIAEVKAVRAKWEKAGVL